MPRRMVRGNAFFSQVWVTAFCLFLGCFYPWVSVEAQENRDELISAPLPAVCRDLISENRGGVHFVEKTRSDFVLPKIANYTYKGRRFTRSVKDQCSYGSCWAASALHLVEDVAAQNGIKVSLSLEYLIATTLLQQSRIQVLDFLEGKKKNFVSEGQYTNQAFQAIRAFGVLPEKAWLPRNKFGEDPLRDARFLNSIRIEQDLAYDAIEKIKYRYRVFQEVLEKSNEPPGYVRLPEIYGKDSLDFFGLPLSGVFSKEQLPVFAELKPVKKILSDLDQKIWSKIVSYLGEPPKYFRFQWKKWSPIDFMFSGFFENDYLQLRLAEDAFEETDVDLALVAIKRMIDQKKMPVVVIQVPAWTCNVEDGFFSVHAYISKCISPSRLLEINKVEAEYRNHAVVVVDYILDKYGEIQWMLVKNSWGKNRGDRGYFHIDRESFVELFQVLERPYQSF